MVDSADHSAGSFAVAEFPGSYFAGSLYEPDRSADLEAGAVAASASGLVVPAFQRRRVQYLFIYNTFVCSMHTTDK